MERHIRRDIARLALPMILALAATCAGATQSANPSPFADLLNASLEQKRGLIFYVNGQSIPGAVTRWIGQQAVEVHNQEYGRIVILLDRIDAIAGN